MALADEALYRAKQNGRNRVEFAPVAGAGESVGRRDVVVDKVLC